MSKSVVSEIANEEKRLSAMIRDQKEAAELLCRPEEEQQGRGYFHTFREILQQPATWLQTGRELVSASERLRKAIAGIKVLILTGSGSSEFAGECVRLPLQQRLSIPVQTIGGGTLLTHGSSAILPGRPGLMVSIARSGDSPESVGAVSLMLENEPEIRHLVITCNADGRLARTYDNDPRVSVVVLSEQTNDRSLVMTSSFTNMVLAAAFLGAIDSPGAYLATISDLSARGEEILHGQLDRLAALARSGFARVVYLGSGALLGAAKESALKMLEMTAGRIWASSETYLGLRHGPMSGIHPDTLVVCYLSSDPLVRAYECDLIHELNDKQLGKAKLLLGEDIPTDLAQPGDLVIDCAGRSALGDENLPVLEMIPGQLLALFRCLKEGLQPDSPSTDGVINRVVQEFRLHGLEN